MVRVGGVLYGGCACCWYVLYIISLCPSKIPHLMGAFREIEAPETIRFR